MKYMFKVFKYYFSYFELITILQKLLKKVRLLLRVDSICFPFRIFLHWGC